MFRLSHRGGPTVYEFLKTLDPDGAAYVTIVGSTQAVTPPPPLYYSSIPRGRQLDKHCLDPDL
jgi:hypothetical protein